MTIMQGDSYNLRFYIYDNDGVELNSSALSEVEVVLGPIRKTLTDGEVTYNDGWIVPLTQQETFKLKRKTHALQVRVKLNDGTTVVGDIDSIEVIGSESKVVL